VLLAETILHLLSMASDEHVELGRRVRLKPALVLVPVREDPSEAVRQVLLAGALVAG